MPSEVDRHQLAGSTGLIFVARVGETQQGGQDDQTNRSWLTLTSYFNRLECTDWMVATMKQTYV